MRVYFRPCGFFAPITAASYLKNRRPKQQVCATCFRTEGDRPLRYRMQVLVSNS